MESISTTMSQDSHGSGSQKDIHIGPHLNLLHPSIPLNIPHVIQHPLQQQQLQPQDNEQEQQVVLRQKPGGLGTGLRHSRANKEDANSINLKKKTRKRTRKFEIDGVVMTTTTSKVIYGDDENGCRIYDDQIFRYLLFFERIEIF